MLNELRKIRYARFRLEMTAASPLRLPPYKGSTFRGAFGHTFKRLVCGLLASGNPSSRFCGWARTCTWVRGRALGWDATRFCN